jgi:hypothetical protein
MYDDILPDDWDDCSLGLSETECGATSGQIVYSRPDYICRVCRVTVRTEYDIEADDDSNYQPGGDDGVGGDEDDGGESEGSTAPVNELEQENSPRENMQLRTYNALREMIEEMDALGEPALAPFLGYFISNIDQLANFYMLFTKYGPYEKYDQPPSLKRAVGNTAAAHMMLNSKITRFSAFALYLSVPEKSLIGEAINHIEIHNGESFKRVAYLIGLYANKLKVPSNFVRPMIAVWEKVVHPVGGELDRIVAFIGAYCSLTDFKLTDTALNEASSVSRAVISRLRKEYTSRLEKL